MHARQPCQTLALGLPPVMDNDDPKHVATVIMLVNDRLAMQNYVKAEVARLTGWTPLPPANQQGRT